VAAVCVMDTLLFISFLFELSHFLEVSYTYMPNLAVRRRNCGLIHVDAEEQQHPQNVH
jgi:hypothetical protein